MARYTLVRRKDARGKWRWYDKAKAPPLDSRTKSVQIMGDIEPFRSIVDGSIVSSRSALRAHNRRNKVIDAGNDPALYRKPTPPKQDIDGIAMDVKKAMYQHGIEY